MSGFAINSFGGYRSVNGPDDLTEGESFSVTLPEVMPAVQKTRDQTEMARLIAYADPLTGSDRFFMEVTRSMASGDDSGADAARAAGLSRYNEIQTSLPWPQE